MFLLNIRNKAFLFNIILEVLANAIKLKKEIQSTQIDKKERKSQRINNNNNNKKKPSQNYQTITARSARLQDRKLIHKSQLLSYILAIKWNLTVKTHCKPQLLSLRAATAAACALQQEKPPQRGVCAATEELLLTTTKEGLHRARKTQHSQK